MPDLARSASHQQQGPLAKGMREFLLFALGGEPYAVELSLVREILSPPFLTRVPRAAPDVIGVCSVRGLLVTVFDLRRKLRIVPKEATRSSRVLLTSRSQGEVVGLFVDEVRYVVRLEGSEIESAQSVLGGEAPDYVLGIGRNQGEVIVVVDLKGMLG